ncbi:MAG: hypothetical protein ACYTET_01270 [Planctomycetota bacterium]|jgi:uncharacterized protein YcfL
MKTQKSTMLTIVAVLMAAILTGCSSSQMSKLDEHEIVIEKQDSSNVKILWADVYQQDGQMYAAGILKQPATNTRTIKTHVDIQIVSADGSVQSEIISGDLIVPANSFSKGLSWKRFKVPLSGELPKGATVNIVVHSGSHDNV